MNTTVRLSYDFKYSNKPETQQLCRKQAYFSSLVLEQVIKLFILIVL